MTTVEATAPGSAPASRATVKLYVASDSPNSAIALANLRLAFDSLPEGSIPTLEVIDVYDFPLAALHEGVVVTPTLLLDHLGKRITMFGDLSDPQRLGAILTNLSS